MAISAGSVAVRVVPSAETFAKDLAAKILPQAAQVGTDIGKTISEGIARGIGDPLSGPLDESSKRQQSKAPRQGDAVAGAFAKGFQDRLRAAFAALPKANIDADSSAADRKIYELRARLEELSGTTIGVDIDEGTALAELAALQAELDALSNHESIQVRADVASAAAELAAIQAEVDHLDQSDPTVHVNADVSGALSGIGTLAIAVGALAAIPVGATLGAGILSLIGPIGAAGAGFGGMAAVAVPAISHIKDALQAQTQATVSSAASAAQAQGRALAEAGAQQQLAAAVRNAAAAHQQALQQVTTAQQQLTSAELAAANAEKALTAARAAARRQLQDIANQVIDAQLAVRQSTFDVADAQSAYNKVVANPQATQDQIARAKLALDQAKQNLSEQQLALKRLQQDQAAADKAGVDGSNQVRSARQQLAAANLQVANSERALAAARANVARADANSADQVASARRAVTQAALQGASANSKLTQSMAALSPAERGLMRDFVGLRSAFSDWARSLEPDVLPVFSHGITLLKDQLPGLTPFAQGAAHAVDGLVTDVGNAARSPFWTQFRQNLADLVPTAITDLGHAGGNVATGLAGIVNAFLPYAPQILAFVTKITAGFARWGQGLGTSNGFARFMEYVKQNAPLVIRTIGDLIASVTHVVSALAPLGPGVLGGFGLLLRIVSGLKPGEIQAIAIAIGVIVAAIKAWRIAQLLLNIALDANPIGLIVVGVGALIAAVVLAYNHVGWFRAGVQAAWNGIKVATLFLWNYALKYVFDLIKFYILNILIPYYKFLWDAVKLAFHGIATVALWLWHNVIHPVWTGIKATIGLAWAGIKIYFKALEFEFNVIATVARWLWHNVLTPVWHGIQSVISVVWNSGIKPVFNAIRTAIGKVGDSFKTGAQAIKAAWDKIKSYAQTPVRFVIDKVINHGILWAWDTVAKWLHLPSNLQIPYLKLPFADGGIVQYANGGVENHTAQIAPAGAMRLWAEPETGGEAYIPLAGNKRGRSTAILGQVADMFGYGLVPFADGGFWDGVGKTASGILNKGVNFAKGAIDAITDPAKWIASHLTSPVKSLLGKIDSTNFGKASVAIGEQSLSSMATALKKLLDLFSSGGAGAQAIINAARAELGQGEQPAGSNNTKYGRWFGINPAPWCAMFVDYVANKAGVGKLIPHTASAPGMARAFGSRYHSGGGGIQPGDVPFFSAGGGISHVGLVEKVNGSSVGTIEGNHSSFVQRVARTVGQIVGYGRPNYPSGGVAGRAPTGGNTPASAQAFARGQLGEFHWSPSQFSPLQRLWNRESGWRWNARNPSSGAYGIPQSLPGSKMASAGADWRTNGDTQVIWGLGYIKGRYGSPAGAWAHSQRTGWYDQGGWLPPGPSLVYNGTGRPEPVFTGDQFDALVDGRSGGGAREYHAHFDGLTGAAIEGHVRSAFNAMEIQAGNRERVGRRR